MNLSFYVVQIPISPLKTYKHTRRMSESWYVIDTLNNVFHLCVNSFLIIIPPSYSFLPLLPQVRNLIERRPKGQTVIAIAHRLSTIRSAGMWFISYILMVIGDDDMLYGLLTSPTACPQIWYTKTYTMTYTMVWSYTKTYTMTYTMVWSYTMTYTMTYYGMKLYYDLYYDSY